MSTAEDFQVVKEGRATILAPKGDRVFYNHIQQFNRDLSVMAIQAWLRLLPPKKNRVQQAAKEQAQEGEQAQEQEGEKPYIRILEALSATGLRAIRYAHEIPLVSKVVANDLLPEAVASIERSARHNNLTNVVGHQGDAIKYMGTFSDADKFHVVDLDPYGTAAPFLDGAVRLVKDGGLLLITCTDAGVLAGNGYPEKCFALYGGNNFGNTAMLLEANHEAGLRLMLGAVAAAGARYKKHVTPLLSLSIDYYFRVFVRVTTSPVRVKQLAASTMLTYYCVGCGHQADQRLGRAAENKFQTPRMTPVAENCPHCDRPYHVAGPMWGGPLHDHAFIDEVLLINAKADAKVYGTTERIRGMLTLARSELPDVPFYFSLNQLCSLLKAPPIPIDDFARAAGNMGFRVSLTHAKKNCIKTDAPWARVLEIAAAWLRRSNERLLVEQRKRLEAAEETKREKIEAKIAALSANIGGNANLTTGMVGYRIMETTAAAEVDFDTRNEQSKDVALLRKLKMVRFQENPTKGWGPKARPGQKQKDEKQKEGEPAAKRLKQDRT